MLIISNNHTGLNTLPHVDKLTNESKDSDSFEKKCARYLRKCFPNHKFTVKGGNNKMFPDILVDDSFYIECKMTENGDKKNGAQVTGFGIHLSEDSKKPHFECSDVALDIPETYDILSYINRHFNDYVAVINPSSKQTDIPLDKNILAKWIYKSYINKNVLFFATIYQGEIVILKNTVGNIKKYFDIILYARYYSNGSKNLPYYQQDDAIAAIKSLYHVKSVRCDGGKTYVVIPSNLDSQYIDVNKDLKIYLSATDNLNEYRVMKITGIGSPRILFKLYSIAQQDKKDFDSLASYLKHTA
jgi:hypothetical protein